MDKIKKVRPITDLRDTNKISNEAHQSDEPIFITKNGYDDLVVMSSEAYQNTKSNKSFYKFPEQSNCFGMIRVGCATNTIKVSNPSFNANEILKIIKENEKNDLDILVFPELALTGYSCGDLFFFDSLLKKSLEALEMLKESLKGNNTLVFVGAPIEYQDKLYNCAIAICNGEILGVIPKSNLPGYGEFYETRQFTEYHNENTTIVINEKEVGNFGSSMYFCFSGFRMWKSGKRSCGRNKF